MYWKCMTLANLSPIFRYPNKSVCFYSPSLNSTTGKDNHHLGWSHAGDVIRHTDKRDKRRNQCASQVGPNTPDSCVWIARFTYSYPMEERPALPRCRVCPACLGLRFRHRNIRNPERKSTWGVVHTGLREVGTGVGVKVWN